jgi:hypothetical protein
MVKAQMRNAAQSVDELRIVIHLTIYPSGEWV